VLKDYRTMDSVRTIRQSLSTSVGNLARPQQKFLLTLFSTLLLSCPKGRYLDQDGYSGRGRPRKYSGKVDLADYSDFEKVTQISDDLTLYTAVVWSISLKRPIPYLLSSE
jgi:hypothetical protein